MACETSGEAGGAFALGHWGMHEVDRQADGGLSLKPWRADPDPSPIGLDQFSKEVDALRVRKPSFREGWLRRGPAGAGNGRGSERFVEVPWDEAFELVAAELKRVIDDHGNEAIFGGSYGWGSAGRFHHAQSQIHRFLNTIGGYVRGRDSYSFGAGSVIMPHIVGPMEQLLDQHTDWETLAEHTQLFVAFGGIPLRNTQMTAGGPGRHRVRAALEKMRANGAKFINISPVRQDVTGDAEWIPIRPGSDVALMLALAHVLLTEGRQDQAFLDKCCVGAEQVHAYVTGASDGIPKSPSWAEAITGIASGRIHDLALQMADAVTMINGSWSIQRQSHGEQSYWALITLASLLGQIGTPGGGFGIGYGTLNSVGSSEGRISGPRLPQGTNAVTEFIPVARIGDALLDPGALYNYNGRQYRYPDLKLIYWAGGNPFHHHQDLNRFIGAWTRPDTIIFHEQFWTSSAKVADIVLPASTSLERRDIGYASREGHLVAMNQLRAPLGASKSDFEIFAGIADKLGKRQDFTEGRDEEGWLRSMYAEFRDRLGGRTDLPDWDTFWEAERLELSTARTPEILLGSFRENPDAWPLKTPSGRIELFSQTISDFGYPDCPGHATWLEPIEWLGSPKAEKHPLHLLSQEPRRRLHSQLDHAPHSRAGKVFGREPILIHASDAARRGIENGDVVRVFNERGACLCGAQVTTDVRQGVVVLATGAWFDPTAWDRNNPLEKHGNPNVLTLDVGCSQLSQATVAQSCLVEIERFAEPVPPVTAFDLPTFVSDES